jgi:glycosyltransferase involved in cell wall biosynthesis
VKVGVYDRYWLTHGGGEQFAGGIARALLDDHDVVLLGPDPLDLDRLSSRLGIDLAGAGFLRVEDDRDVSHASAGLDLLVNCTYLSPAVNLAARGLYVVHFPADATRAAVRRLGRVARVVERAARGATAAVLGGFHPPEPSGARWTTGFGTLSVDAPAGARLDLALSAVHTPAPADWEVIVKVGTARREVRLADGPSELSLPVPPTGDGPPVVVAIASPHFVPVDAYGTTDRRQLGVLVERMTLDDRPVGTPGRRRPSVGVRHDLAYLRSYDRIVANSHYTAAWCRKLWAIDAELLHPPVRARRALGKTRSIVSIGRFFGAERGHSKKQLEMVEAFRRLSAEVDDEWELHLVGGCSPEDREYGLAVRRAAQGLRVHVHFNAPSDDVEELLGRASISWHVTGLGEDAERHPHRMEHFGIAVVEAMWAGAVPVVYGIGGPREIVRHGVDGLHCFDEAGLLGATRRLIDDPGERDRLAASAAARAEGFGMAPFSAHLRDLAAATLAGSGRPTT